MPSAGGETCVPEIGDCRAEAAAGQPVPRGTRGIGCGIYNGVSLIRLPASLLLWLSLRSRRRARP